MAQLVVAAAGAAIGGSVITGTVLGMTGASLGWMAGSMLGSALFSKGQHQQGPRLDDLRVAGTEYGQTIPWTAASPRIAGQIVWASDRREIANTQKVGKGGGGSKVTTYTYEVDLLILLTENEIGGVSRIWSNGELVYNGATTKDGVWSNVTIYTGASDQLPDPIYEAAVGAGNAPAYRGRGYVVIQSLQLGSSGQIPNLTFEIGGSATVPVPQYIKQISLIGDVGYVDHAAGTFQTCVMGASYVEDSQVKRDFTFRTYSFETGSVLTTEVVTVASPIIGGSTNGVFYDPFFVRNVPSLAGMTNTANFGTIILSNGQTYINSGCQFALNTADWVYALDGVYYCPSVVGGIRYMGTLNNTSDLWLIPNASGEESMGVFYDDIADRKYVLSWNSSTNRIYIAEFQSNPGTLLWQTEVPVRVLSPGSQAIQSIRNNILTVCGREAGVGGRYNITVFSVGSDGTLTSLGSLSDEPFSQQLSFAVSNKFAITNDGYVYRVDPQNTGVQFTEPISDVVSNLMIRSGYDVGDYELDEPSDTKPVRGISVGRVSSTRTVLEMLQQSWFYEASKSDKIYIRPRAATSLVTIPFSELGTGQDGGESEPLALEIGSDIEIPAQVALSYNNIEADYNIATEHSDRIISGQVTTATVQMPIGMLSSEAKGVADALVLDQVASLTRTTVRLPLKYAYLEPGDVFEAVNFDGRTYRLRIQSKRDSLSVMECSCVLDDVGALQSAEITDDGYITVTDPTRVAPTLFRAMDIPILRDVDNDIGYYAAIAADRLSDDDEWPGAVFVQAFSTNAYEQEFTTGESAVIGACNTALPDWTGGNVFDESSTVEVEVVGELSSTTRTAMLGNLTINAMLIGSEIIRFRLAELVDSSNGRNTYILSGLLRGQRGTEWAQTGHGSNEPCVLLGNPLRRVSDTLTEIGVERDVKAVTLNTLLSSVTDVQFTNTAIGLKPFSPANVLALADGSDVVVTWQRRTRLAVKYGGAVDQFVPLGEASEQYRVEIFNGLNLVRTATVTSPTYTYASADIASDGFNPGDPITFIVSQLSAIVGAGYPTTTTGIAP
jgi:hypothetical protein